MWCSVVLQPFETFELVFLGGSYLGNFSILTAPGSRFWSTWSKKKKKKNVEYAFIKIELLFNTVACKPKKMVPAAVAMVNRWWVVVYVDRKAWSLELQSFQPIITLRMQLQASWVWGEVWPRGVDVCRVNSSFYMQAPPTPLLLVPCWGACLGIKRITASLIV